MTVRAIDMITLVPRAGEVGRAQQQSLQHAHVFQHAQAAQQLERAKRAQQQVAEKAPAEQAQVRKDGGGGQGAPGERRESRRRAAATAPGDAPTPPGVGQRLDVKI